MLQLPRRFVVVLYLVLLCMPLIVVLFVQIWRYAEVVDLLNAVIDGSGVVAAIRTGVALSGTAQDAGFFAMVVCFVLFAN